MTESFEENDELKVGLIQMECPVGDVTANVAKAVERIDAAAGNGCQLIVLPEFFNTGYFPVYWNTEYMRMAETATGETMRRICAQAARSHAYVVACIYEVDRPGFYYDTAFLASPEGRIVGRYRKTHAPARISFEKLYFRTGYEYPVFRIGPWTVGVTICYDTYFPESIRCLAISGADLIVTPYADVALPLWIELFRVRAFENLVYVAVCNMVGREGSDAVMEFGGRSLVVDPAGDVIAIASSGCEEMISARLFRGNLYATRRQRHLWRDRNPGAYQALADREESVRARSLGAP